MSEFTVRAVELRQIHPYANSWIGLEAVEVVPAERVHQFAPVVEPFVVSGENPIVFAWTEDTLRRMDRLGIPFPISVSLYGPIMMPSLEDSSEVFPVWYSTGFIWQGGFDIIVAVVRIIDELMDGTLPDETLSYEDRRFLAWNYPSWWQVPQEYKDAVSKRLRKGVKESELKGSHV